MNSIPDDASTRLVSGLSGRGCAFHDLFDVAFGIGELPTYRFPLPARRSQDFALTFVVLIDSLTSRESVALLVRRDTSIEEVRDRACDHFGRWTASRYYSLSYEGMPLHTGRRLRDYGIDSFERIGLRGRPPSRFSFDATIC